MGMHYEVKVCINHKYDHFTGGKEVYDYLKQNINLQFNPFHNWMHDLINGTLKSIKLRILLVSLLREKVKKDI